MREEDEEGETLKARLIGRRPWEIKVIANPEKL
jgi:hypothetical protein